MSITLEEVNHIAMLARLDLSTEEKQCFQRQLSDILDHFARLKDLDTEDITPTSSVLPPRSRLRADIPKNGLTRERALENAPDLEAEQFRVPPVME